MFTFISIMAVGVLIGYPLRHKSQIRKITPLIHIVVCLLLFLLGLSIGLNRLIIDNLGYFCGQAAVISSLSILGSMMASLQYTASFSEERGQTVKSSLVTLAFFLFGCVAGVSYAVDFDVHQTSVYVLYVLMLLLGINLGSNRNLRQFVLSLNFRTLLVPFATVSGTLLFSAIGGFLLSRWSIFDCMAVGSGFSYYSVSPSLSRRSNPLHRCAACYRIGDHRATIQYLPGNDRLDRSSPFPQIFRLSGTYLGGGHRFFRHFPGSHRTLLRTGSRTRGHRPRHTDKHKHAFLRFFLLQTVS